MMNKKTMIKVLLINALVLGILLSMNLSVVSAFGVSEDNTPFYLMPGESGTYNFRLQNMVGDTDYLVKVGIQEDELGLLSLADGTDEYLVNAGQYGIKVNLIVKVPETARIGDVYFPKVSFTLQPVGAGEEAPVALVTGFVNDIKINVGEEPKPQPQEVPSTETTEKPESPISLLTWVIILLILIALVIVIMSSVRKKKK